VAGQRPQSARRKTVHGVSHYHALQNLIEALNEQTNRRPLIRRSPFQPGFMGLPICRHNHFHALCFVRSKKTLIRQDFTANSAQSVTTTMDNRIA